MIPLKANCFFNLTSAPLSRFTTLFNLGLKHIPIPNDVTDHEIKRQFNNFKNRILWQLHHKCDLVEVPDSENLDTDLVYVPGLKPPRKNIKPCYFVSKNHLIQGELDWIESQLNRYASNYHVTQKKNDTIRDIHILKSRYPEIVFRPADKNLGLCAIHLSHYNQLVLEHLSNTSNYQLKASDSIMSRKLLKQLVKSYDDFKLEHYWYRNERPLINHHFEFTWPKFHVLPKLHKPGIVKGRPIAGQVNWITTPLARILEHRLRPVLRDFTNVLKNSFSLVQHIEEFNHSKYTQNDDLWFITGDIESLYPNIQISRLLKIINKKDPTCTALCEFVCNNSYVQYDQKIYKQLNGIPMGTNAAVSLANIYVGTLIDGFIESRPNCIYFRRYIDDLFIIWKGDISSWNNIASGCQSLLGIPINWEEPSKTQATFLDLNIIRNYNGSITTSVFQKELNKYNYISPSSFHSQHMFTGFIYGELQRYARLCNNAYAYGHVKKLFYRRLLARGYSSKVLSMIFKKHRWTKRDKMKDDSSPLVLPFVLPFTARSHAKLIKDVIKSRAPQIESYFSYSRVLFADARTRNIKDMLCPSSISKAQSKLLRSRSYRYRPVARNAASKIRS